MADKSLKNGGKSCMMMLISRR